MEDSMYKIAELNADKAIARLNSTAVQTHYMGKYFTAKLELIGVIRTVTLLPCKTMKDKREELLDRLYISLKDAYEREQKWLETLRRK